MARAIALAGAAMCAACSSTCNPSRSAAGSAAKPPRTASAAEDAARAESDESANGERATRERPETARAWTTFRGSTLRNGRSPVRGPRRAKLKWVFRTQGRIYADAAVRRDGTLLVVSQDGNLYAVGTNGREIWSFDLEGKSWTSPAVGRDGTIYVGSDADRLLALSPDGDPRWTFSTERPPPEGESASAGLWDVDTSPLLLADGTVVFGCHTYLIALRPSGSQRWSFEAGAGDAKIFSSPAAAPDGTIYFGTQGDFFFALDSAGEVRWHLETGGDNDGTPAVGDDGTVYFGSDDGKLRAIAPGGTPRWIADLEAPLRAPLAIAHDGTVLAPTYGRRPFVAALDGKSGEEKWRFEIEPGKGDFYGIQSGPLVDGEDYVYFGGRDHFIYCLSPDGELVWKHETGDQLDSGPVLAPDGTLYIGSDDHRLYAFAR
jgi:outer membrane protein assembly factor BamB